MNAPHSSARTPLWRKRAAAVFAAVGALVFSSGIVMLSAPAANAAADKVGVCHRKGSGQYIFVSVAASATGEPHGHATHLEGAPGSVTGAPDYVMTSPSVPDDVDTDAEFMSWCVGLNDDPTVEIPPQPADVVVTETQSEFDCDLGTRTQTRTVTKPYDWSDTANAWVLSDEAGWIVSGWGAWSAYVAPTPADKVAAECDVPTKPAVTTRILNQSEKDCTRGGLLTWTDLYSTDWTWDAATWAWVPGTETGPVSGVKTFTAYTAAELKTACPADGGNGGGGTPDPVIPNPEPVPGLTFVTPNYPSATEADCAHRGFLVVPPQPAGVLMTRSGSVPGDVTFTFAPADGYAFPDGTDTDVTVTVAKKLSGEDCILGEETTKPKPHGTKSKPKPRDRAPIVLGTQAAVPTAVDAGLAGLPSASVSPISSPRLAQALVAGGLLLLIAGGSMGLGRRTRGAHES